MTCCILYFWSFFLLSLIYHFILTCLCEWPPFNSPLFFTNIYYASNSNSKIWFNKQIKRLIFFCIIHDMPKEVYWIQWRKQRGGYIPLRPITRPRKLVAILVAKGVSSLKSPPPKNIILCSSLLFIMSYWRRKRRLQSNALFRSWWHFCCVKFMATYWQKSKCFRTDGRLFSWGKKTLYFCSEAAL